jgi:hypothetical protein
MRHMDNRRRSTKGSFIELFKSFASSRQLKARILQTLDLPMTPADIRAPRLATESNPWYSIAATSLLNMIGV